jgi:CelD/BcsL family acetyltransferase involved in cellulose biosynthesis
MEQATTQTTASQLALAAASGPAAQARVVRLATSEQIQPWVGQWNAMARGVPFRRWEWLETWWRHYGAQFDRQSPSRELFVLAAFDSRKTLLGVAPWYLERSASQGRVVRFLGSGEVCSEYLSLLCADGKEEIVARSLAKWLTETTKAATHDARNETQNDTHHDTISNTRSGQSSDRWDALKLFAIANDDLVMGRLLEHLASHGNAVYRRPGISCWRLALPANWEDYLAIVSKSHRKQLRRLDRDFFRSGRARMHWVHDPDQLEHALDVLIRLHQRRWKRLGWPGCFASERFLKFHREVALRMLAFDALSMSWLELDGRPVAAEYHLRGNGIVYAYQSGIAPDSLEYQPGHLSHLATIRRAIERGDRAFDFLRGDEPYKSHWRAVARPTFDARVVPPRMGPRIRQGIWAAGSTVVNQLRHGWQLTKHLISE